MTAYVPAQPTLLDDISWPALLRWLTGAILGALLNPFRHHPQHYRHHGAPTQPVIVAALEIAAHRDQANDVAMEAWDRVMLVDTQPIEVVDPVWPTEDTVETTDADKADAIQPLTATDIAYLAALRGRDATDTWAGNR